MSAPSRWSSRTAALPFCLLFVAALLAVLPAGAQEVELPSPDGTEPEVPDEPPDFASLACDVIPVFAAEDGDRWSALRIRLRNFSDQPRRLSLEFAVERGKPPGILTWDVELGPEEELRRLVPVYVGTDRTAPGQVRVYEDGEQISPAGLSSLRFQVVAGQWVGAWGAHERPRVLVVNPAELEDTRQFRDELKKSFLKVYGKRSNPVRRYKPRQRRRLSGQVDIEIECQYQDVAVEELPVHAEAYGAADRLVLVATGPGELSEAQQRALRQAVHGGLVVWIVPGKGGEGNEWVLIDGESAPAAHEHVIDEQQYTFFLQTDRAAERGELLAEIDPLGEKVQGSNPASFIPAAYSYQDGLGQWRRLTSRRLEGLVESKVRGWSTQFSYPVRTRTGGLDGGNSVHWGWRRALGKLWARGVRVEYIFGFIAVYLLCVGPGLFLFLRRRGRLIWLLWLQPVVVVVFLAATFVVGYLNFGVIDRAHQVVFLFQPENSDWAHGVAVLSRYSAGGGEEAFSTRGGTLPMLFPPEINSEPLQRWRLTTGPGGERARIEGVFFSQWTLRHLISQGPVYVGGSLRVTPERSDGVRIENRLGMAAHRPAVYLRQHLTHDVSAENIPDGEVVVIRQANLPAPAAGETEQRWRALIESVVTDAQSKYGARPLAVVELSPGDLPAGVPCSFNGDLDTDRVFLVQLDDLWRRE